MNKVFKSVAVAAAIIGLFGCEEVPQNNDGNTDTDKVIKYTEDIEFELAVKSVTANAAEITISHNGHEDDTWYAFATTSTNVSLSIDKAVEELTAAGGKVSGLSSGTKQAVTVDGLEHSTDYTYIVFAMTAEGDVYGSHSDISFTTPLGFAPNSEWSVEYTGRQYIGENEYEHTVTVESSDKNPYFITIVTKDRYDNTAIGDLICEEMASLEQFISEYNRYYGEHTTIKDWSHIGDGIDPFGIELGKTYVAMAIGVTHTSELTGHYAVSEEFEPYEEAMTDGYASWIGTWKFTGANGVAFDVTFEKMKSNDTYIMTGWEGEQAEQHEVIVYWYPTENTWILWSQYIGTFTSAGYGDFDLYFCPANFVDGGGQEVYTTDGVPICIGCDMPNGEKMVLGYAEGDRALYTHMRFAGVWSDGVGGITATTDFPTFPLTVTPVSSTKSVENNHKPVKRFR